MPRPGRDPSWCHWRGGWAKGLECLSSESGPVVISDHSAAAGKGNLMGYTLTTTEYSDSSAFASALGALHPPGGGDGWDGVGNKHE